MVDRLARPGLPSLAFRRREGAGPTFVFLPGYGSNMEGTKAVTLDAWAASVSDVTKKQQDALAAAGGSAGNERMQDD